MLPGHWTLIDRCCAGTAAVCPLRREAGSPSSRRVGLGRSAWRNEAQARHPVDPLGRIYRTTSRRLSLFVVLRSLPGLLRAFAGDNAADACNGVRLLVDHAGHGIPVVVDRLTGVATFAATNPPPSPSTGNAISPNSRTYPWPTVAAHTLNLPNAIHNEPDQPASTEQFALSGHLPFHFGMSENQ